jgi:hypothetical protein
MINFKRIYLFILFYYILYSYSSKNIQYFKQNNIIINNNLCYNNIKNIKLKCILYNLQRLPYLLRDIKIDKIIDNYDLIILQEYFNDFLLYRNNYLKNTNKYFNTGGKNILTSKIIDSGLVNISNYNLELVEFINFKNNKSVDKYANKGFLVSKLHISNFKPIIIINTHLQNFYSNFEYNCSIISEQLSILNQYILNLLNLNNDVIVLGDFNRNIDDIIWTIKPTQIIKTKYPTVWDNKKGILPLSTPYQVNLSQIPYWSDGGFIWSKKKNITISTISNVIIDKYTDHCGIEFILNII